MKKNLIIVCVMVAAGLTKADLIADWDFNGSGETTASPIPADFGSGTINLSLNSSFDATISVDGTPKNEYVNDTSGQGNALYFSGGTRENGKSIIFTLSTSGDQKLVLTYATRDTGTTGFTMQTLSYSTDGGLNYSSSGITVNTVSGNTVSLSSSSSYSVETVDFSSVTALNDRSSILIQLSLSGAPSGTTGSDHFDNIQFNATPMIPVPEPAAWGAVSGLGLLGICGLRTWRQRRSGNHIAMV